MVYICKICQEEKDESKFPHENGKVRRYTCWSCRQKRELAQQKLRLLDAFGCRCECCGERMPAFLTLDHKVGGRRHHEGLTNLQIYARAAKEGWPRDRYQLLCMNCNFAKGHYGVCPHQLGITPEVALAELRERASVAVESSFTTGHVTEAQLQALDRGSRHGPRERIDGVVAVDNFASLGVTKKQLLQAVEAIKARDASKEGKPDAKPSS
jgi:hypothetical protein